MGTLRGLEKFAIKTNTFLHYRHKDGDPNSISSDIVRVLYEDRSGSIWVRCGEPWPSSQQNLGGLNNLNSRSGRFTRYFHKELDSTSLTENRVTAIYEDSQDNFWVGTTGDGLHKMNRARGTFQRFHYNPAHTRDLSRPPVSYDTIQTYRGVDHITSFAEDNSGRLWILTLAGGINVYDPASKKISYYGTGSNSKDKLNDNMFWAAYRTRDFILWISPWGNNIYKIDPFEVKVPHTNLGKTVFPFGEDEAHS